MWQSRMHQEPVSPAREQLPWQNLSDVNILKHRSLFEGLKHPREGLNGKFWFVDFV